MFNKPHQQNTDVNANSVTPVFHQHSAWQKIRVEFMSKTHNNKTRDNNKNIFNGTAKETKTNSLWIVLNYAM